MLKLCQNQNVYYIFYVYVTGSFIFYDNIFHVCDIFQYILWYIYYISTYLFLLYIARRYNVKLLLQKNTFCKIRKKTPAPESLFLIKFDAFMPEACNFIKKETLALVFSCKFWDIFKNPFFIEHLWWLLLYFNNLSFLCYMKSFIKIKYQKFRWDLISVKTKLWKINPTEFFFCQRMFFSQHFLRRNKITDFVWYYENILKNEGTQFPKNFESFKIFVSSHKRLASNEDILFSFWTKSVIVHCTKN